MTTDSDNSQQLAAQITEAHNNKQPIVISAGGSKLFYGRTITAEKLETTTHTGILSYKPSELVLTARSGTRIKDIENELTANNQILAFEPPCHSNDATIGGGIACALSGPRRPYCGAARDFVLGAKIINGKGEILKFGGQVMKNVAGYDASRLMVGRAMRIGSTASSVVTESRRPSISAALTTAVQVRESRIWRSGNGLGRKAKCSTVRPFSSDSMGTSSPAAET
jgi:glycolate oxidase FAD binding subunit